MLRMACVSRIAISVWAALMLISCKHIETIPQEAPATRICPGIAPNGSSAVITDQDCPPTSPREFRGLWVATVANIDWPSKAGLSAQQQQSEAIAILNRAQSLHLNAVLLQVRPSADALYASSLEPWAEWLTGEQGRSPGYDPLAFWITEAKKRGIELHAWFNPYRAKHTKALSPNAKDHVANRLPGAVKSYGGYLWLDPGDRAAQQHTLNVIMDVLRRYDIDGVHFDDYFYPYPVIETAAKQQPTGAAPSLTNAGAHTVVSRNPERDLEFPDEPSWKAYLATGGKLSRADWRRDNVNQFIERVYSAVKAEKPWVRVGISPFGIGRPDRRPPGIVGFSQYDKLYADVELWLQRGWLDYLAPQLYWPIDQTPQAFATLLDYWHAQNPLRKDIYPGLYTSRIDGTARAWSPKEIEQQISLVRAKRDVSLGHIHFSAAPIVQNRQDLAGALAAVYAHSAISQSNHISCGKRVKNYIVDLSFNHGDNPSYLQIDIDSQSERNADHSIQSPSEAPSFAALHLRYGLTWHFATLPVTRTNNAGQVNVSTTVASANPDGALNRVAATWVDRCGRESAPLIREVTQIAQ